MSNKKLLIRIFMFLFGGILFLQAGCNMPVLKSTATPRDVSNILDVMFDESISSKLISRDPIDETATVTLMIDGQQVSIFARKGRKKLQFQKGQHAFDVDINGIATYGVNDAGNTPSEKMLFRAGRDEEYRNEWQQEFNDILPKVLNALGLSHKL